MKNITRFTLLVLSFLLAGPMYAEKWVGYKSEPKSSDEIKSTAAGCLPGRAFKWLELNNVRARINSGGDMWWDFETAQYEVPKNSKKTSMFSSALWIGGKDVAGQLKVAAQRYRSGPGGSNRAAGSLVDFYPGPLTVDNTASIDVETCQEWDKLHAITRAQVDDFITWYADNSSIPNYQIPSAITDYPAHGNTAKRQSYYMAPFFDADGDGTYNPASGDYPYYDLANDLCHTQIPTMEGNGILVDQVLKGDETLWWVFNDRGNLHNESGGGAANQIGMEIRAQAFGFTTADEINNMTFYSFELINRSTYTLTETYFCQWVDTDLGDGWDDYVGCDVRRGLGYCYNGDPVDGDNQIYAYGENPPAIGVDFFQGPYMDPDGLDNMKFDENKTYDSVWQNGAWVYYNPQTICDESINGVNFANGIVDDERFGMRKFLYHNNSSGGMGDPGTAQQYYNYLIGIWKDGTPMQYGGNGHSGNGVTGIKCDFMFPGTTDDFCHWGTGGVNPNYANWTEEKEKNAPSDRRFMQSAGPFTLKPGAVNYITVGIPWARATSGGPYASVELLKQADDKCQMLFDNCFKVISGPNAPDMTIRELDKEIIILLSNRETPDAGNNYNESYVEYDPRIIEGDSAYRFEGYKIFQLLNSSVSAADLDNLNLARLVYQCDVKNGVTDLINYVYDADLQGLIAKKYVRDATDAGIHHAVSLKLDAFENTRLVNHKQYYYMAVAYGYNCFKPYKQDAAPVPGEPQTPAYDGQKEPYLQGRKNLKVAVGIPHAPVGVLLHSGFGTGVEVTRIAGQGNGGNALDLTDATVADVMRKKPPVGGTQFSDTANYPITYYPTYKAGKGPINVRVVDPLNVIGATFELTFDSLVTKEITTPKGGKTTIQDGNWTLIKTSNTERGDTIQAAAALTVFNEQVFLKYGIAITIEQVFYPESKVTGTVTGTTDPLVETLAFQNGYISSEMSFADSTKIWLTGIQDAPYYLDEYQYGFNWIRSGSYSDAAGTKSDWNMLAKTPYDPDKYYEKVLGGWWSPYNLAASANDDPQKCGPADPTNTNGSKKGFNPVDLASVYVVLTSDKTKWTRCVVIELCPDVLKAENGGRAFFPRAHKSVNINGETDKESSDPSLNSNFIDSTGMGWFPGYAINMETGERLNIMFGENSSLTEDNGRDMLFNPTSNYLNSQDGTPILGGQHYIYVMAHVENKAYMSRTNPDYDNPAYDYGATLRKKLMMTTLPWRVHEVQWSNCMWTAIPMAMPNVNFLACDVTIKLNVGKPYARYASIPQALAGIPTSENDYWPKYRFTTNDVPADFTNKPKKVSDLDKINVVPNPYKAGSTYETSNVDNRVRIINLPQKCVVKIYSVDGNLIREYKKDSSGASIDWDLKNQAGIPIASGMYLVHVKVDGVGEKTVKWFGVTRAVDFSGF